MKAGNYEIFASILSDTKNNSGILTGYCKNEPYPYGTWVMYCGNTFSGEYFKTKEEAIENMLRRANIDLDA